MDNERRCISTEHIKAERIELIKYIVSEWLKEDAAQDVVSFFFFFQAEDGIRDVAVTGVQTCALPISGDEIYTAKASAKAVRLAELLGMPATQARQIYANFPETHPLWVGSPPAARLTSLDFPKNPDVVINVGNKLQHNSPAPVVPREAKFIDMRIDSWSMGNVMNTEIPLVADVAYGLDDLTAAVEGLITPASRKKFQERAQEVRRFSEKAKALRALVAKNPEWDRSPMLSDRVTWEVARFADKDAIIVHEAGSVVLHGFEVNPAGRRQLFFYYGPHPRSGGGPPAGVKPPPPHPPGNCPLGAGSF